MPVALAGHLYTQSSRCSYFCTLNKDIETDGEEQQFWQPFTLEPGQHWVECFVIHESYVCV